MGYDGGEGSCWYDGDEGGGGGEGLDVNEDPRHWAAGNGDCPRVVSGPRGSCGFQEALALWALSRCAASIIPPGEDDGNGNIGCGWGGLPIAAGVGGDNASLTWSASPS